MALEAATCAVIFFDGDWVDAGVAAVCGFAAGSIEWALTAASTSFGSAEVKDLVDVLAGGITGIIGGLFFEFVDYPFCLSAIFLGTLYWFFYGRFTVASCSTLYVLVCLTSVFFRTLSRHCVCRGHP